MPTLKITRKTKKVRKHKGIHQTGGKAGKLQKGYKYSGKKLKNGLSQIVKVKKGRNSNGKYNGSKKNNRRRGGDSHTIWHQNFPNMNIPNIAPVESEGMNEPIFASWSSIMEGKNRANNRANSNEGKANNSKANNSKANNNFINNNGRGEGQ